MKTRSIRLPDALDAELTDMATKQGISINEAIEWAIECMVSGDDIAAKKIEAIRVILHKNMRHD